MVPNGQLLLGGADVGVVLGKHVKHTASQGLLARSRVEVACALLERPQFLDGDVAEGAAGGAVHAHVLQGVERDVAADVVVDDAFQPVGRGARDERGDKAAEANGRTVDERDNVAQGFLEGLHVLDVGVDPVGVRVKRRDVRHPVRLVSGRWDELGAFERAGEEAVSHCLFALRRTRLRRCHLNGAACRRAALDRTSPVDELHARPLFGWQGQELSLRDRRTARTSTRRHRAGLRRGRRCGARCRSALWPEVHALSAWPQCVRRQARSRILGHVDDEGLVVDDLRLCGVTSGLLRRSQRVLRCQGLQRRALLKRRLGEFGFLGSGDLPLLQFRGLLRLAALVPILNALLQGHPVGARLVRLAGGQKRAGEPRHVRRGGRLLGGASGADAGGIVVVPLFLLGADRVQDGERLRVAGQARHRFGLCVRRRRQGAQFFVFHHGPPKSFFHASATVSPVPTSVFNFIRSVGSAGFFIAPSGP